MLLASQARLNFAVLSILASKQSICHTKESKPCDATIIIVVFYHIPTSLAGFRLLKVFSAELADIINETIDTDHKLSDSIHSSQRDDGLK